MPTAIETLQAALLAQCLLIVDPIDQAEAQMLVSEYIGLRQAVLALSSSSVSSYSIAGRSVTKSNLTELRLMARQARENLRDYLPDTAVQASQNGSLVADMSRMDY